jgi:hypothetical protein
MESLIENVDIRYSIICKKVKYTPRKIVVSNIAGLSTQSHIRLWCLQVIVTPEDNRIAVLKSGILIGFIGTTENGGQIIPQSTNGLRELWKNDQKKARKNITSDKINKTIPSFNPVCTPFVCSPIIVASRITSRHHKVATTITENNEPIKYIEDIPLNHETKLNIIVITVNPIKIGHSLGETKCH